MPTYHSYSLEAAAMAAEVVVVAVAAAVVEKVANGTDAVGTTGRLLTTFYP